jgi:adenylyltransferase/sulfurtransferase
MTATLPLSEEQFHRYARHLILDEVGEEGQARLLRSRVLVLGAGGLGSPLILYLAAAGVGTIGVVDNDMVELSNLQRQVIHANDRLGQAKTESAALSVAGLNPDIRVVQHRLRLDAGNVHELIADYDLVADGSDNFATRYVLNDACYFAGKTLVSAALLRFDAQLSTFKAHLGGDNPCFRCLHPAAPPPGLVPRCEEAGILGALAGAVGSLQATEVLKELLGLGQGLSGRLLLYDALGAEFLTIRLKPNPACPLCGEHPTIARPKGR